VPAAPAAPFGARRADIEFFAWSWKPVATITRRLCTIAGFCRHAVEEELLDYSPAAHVRWPRLDYGSKAVGLDRNELAALLVAAGLGLPVEHALISLLASPCSPSTGCGCLKPQAPTSKRSASSTTTERW
jgi:hypothetical protein